MDWNDFAQRLTLELSRLPVTSFVIVQGLSGLPYVQAMRAEGLFDAEAVSSAFLPRPLAPGQERRLRALGWEPPDDEERRNWWRQFPVRERGRTAAEHLETCALLAGQMVGAFRDAYGIESPLGLVYQASRSGPDGGPLSLPGLGIRPAVPEGGGRPAARPARPSGSALESALTEARERGDQSGYLELLARAVLYLPAPGEPGAGGHQFATAQFGDGTFVLAFTSPEAMDRSLQGQAVHHREASLSELARRWPHPEWQLAINPGLPSASFLDAKALFEPEEPRPAAAPTPPAPTDVHVAGASVRSPSRGRTGGAAGERRAAAPKAPSPPESPAPQRAEPRPPSAVRAASQPPTRPPAPPAPPPSPRETPSDPQGLPVTPTLEHGPSVTARDVVADRPASPQRTPDAPSPGGGQEKTSLTRQQTVPFPREHLFVEGTAQVVVMQKVVRPEHVQHYLEGGYDLVAGYVHRLQDVAEMKTPAAMIHGLGLLYEGSPFAPTDEEVFAIRWPAVKPPLFRRPLGGSERTSADGPAIPEFKIESQRLPHGAELYRIVANGPETLVASYDADYRRWLVRLPGGRE
ncbi:SseB family protein [Actinomadura decatromicini]|uniref:SseB family protein n=1 Tax=Actinomadura decatromicini TaxID=2604572 RepID=A0A5D3FE96_9ACTN|nr:SseB family protein [Actinomadura decatromicini]TYK46284.1 SseB family protein [Actinomadura decatromicini]